ncbi:hypothetical protein H4219_004999 [Mycoemilia scoparia]|uniref:HMG box domain-containing protein n=1 Tax=Mycoemilia scoparia TaxID=417184 RepID=A0A9W7ZZA1_9FUNG|nr:hypothetical protein H4219_004999 [Mycoemilia scoparia]
MLSNPLSYGHSDPVGPEQQQFGSSSPLMSPPQVHHKQHRSYSVFYPSHKTVSGSLENSIMNRQLPVPSPSAYSPGANKQGIIKEQINSLSLSTNISRPTKWRSPLGFPETPTPSPLPSPTTTIATNGSAKENSSRSCSGSSTSSSSSDLTCLNTPPPPSLQKLYQKPQHHLDIRRHSTNTISPINARTTGKVKKLAMERTRALFTRSPNIFMLYRSDKSKEIKRQQKNSSDINQTEVSRIAKQYWEKETEKVKDIYKKRGEQCKKEIEKRQIEWLKNHPQAIEMFVGYGSASGEKKNTNSSSRGSVTGKRKRSNYDYRQFFSLPNTFLEFRKDMLDEIMAKDPGLNQKIVSKKCALAWKNQPESVKRIYQDRCKKSKDQKLRIVADIIFEDIINEMKENGEDIFSVDENDNRGGGGGVIGGFNIQDEEDEEELGVENVDIELGSDGHETHLMPSTPCPTPIFHTIGRRHSSYQPLVSTSPTRPFKIQKTLGHLHRISSLMNPVSDNDDE